MEHIFDYGVKMSHNIPDGLHDAIFRLLKLLDRFHSEGNVSEREFHDLFENNDEIWDCLGYSRIISEPTCDLVIEDEIAGEYIEPDFFAYSEYKNRWEIIDLKLPLESLILRSEGRRTRFKSKIEDYISQVREYNRYFDEHEHRKHVELRHGIKIPKSPPVALVLGSNIKQEKINNITGRYDIDVDVYQYNNILDLLKKRFAEYYGGSEELPGATIATVIELTKRPTDSQEYIFDMGQKLNSNRVSLYLKKDTGLNFEMITEHGQSRSVSIPLGENLAIDEPVVLYIEIASSTELSYVRIFIGAKIMDQFLMTEEIPIDIFGDDGDMRITFGANMLGNQNAAFLMGEHLTYSKVQPLDTRLEIIDYLRDKWGFE